MVKLDKRFKEIKKEITAIKKKETVTEEDSEQIIKLSDELMDQVEELRKKLADSERR